MSFQVLNFGSLNIDHVYRMQHFVMPGETVGCKQYSVFAGGKGLNQSIALARAGIRVSHAGKIGNDGEFLRDILRDSGVDISFIMQGSVPTGHANIQVDDSGQNCIILYPGANHAIEQAEITAILDQQTPGTWLMLQNEINDIPYIMKEAGKRGMKIAINPAPCTDEVQKYPLDLVDLLFVNEIEAAQLSGCSGTFDEIAQTLADRYPQLQIVMTLGSAGAIYRSGAKQVFQPVIPADVVDTTSAGDTFCGYFLSALLKDYPPEKAMEIAAKASAIAVSRQGAAQSIPTADEVF